MPTNDPSILFRLSGVVSGINDSLYIFEQNPSEYTNMSPKGKFNILETIEGENIYNRTFFDNEVRKLEWQVGSYDLYANLKKYAYRDVNRELPICYFWDGTVYEFQGAPVQVVDVYGTPLTTIDYLERPKWKIELQFKPVTIFDNKKAFQ